MKNKQKNDIIDAYPLSKMQSGMYFHYATTQEQVLYHDIFNLRIASSWQSEAFQSAVSTLLEKHIALRTSFEFTKFSQPVQLVHKQGIVRFSELDPDCADDQSFDVYVETQIANIEDSPFDLAKQSLIRFTVIRKNDREFQLLVDAHHMILDGWSMASLLTELFQNYLANIGVIAAPPSTLSAASFKDFIRSEIEEVARGESAKYWQQYLAEHEHKSFSFAPTSGSGKVQNLRAVIPTNNHALNNIAQHQKTSLKEVLMAAHLRVVAYIQGTTKAASTYVSNGRPETLGGDTVAGLFLNVLPIHVDIHQLSWSALISQVNQMQTAAMRYRRFPFAEMVQNHGNGISDIHFNFVHFHVYKAVQGIDQFQIQAGEIRERSNFPLAVTFHLGVSGELELLLRYRDNVLSEQDAQRVLAYYLKSIANLAAYPEALCTEHPLYSPQEDRALHQSNETSRTYKSELAVHEQITEQVLKRADAVALRCGESTVNYSELLSGAQCIAGFLQSQGVGRGDLVGICMGRGITLLMSILGVLKSGAGYVPFSD
ncbi:condensation domain-containing protein, partial [Paraglaciecola sp.]|uniref:condensation domain-containing protein n=1 Tax=Paraglaciecola sp. TaxID=1920173 RepID=UPI0030F432A4